VLTDSPAGSDQTSPSIDLYLVHAPLTVRSAKAALAGHVLT